MRTTFDRAFYRPAGIATAITDDALGIEVFAPDHWTAYA